jgi:bifunctional DNA-binding transcriptional regulator/antitoxin component of YhaV-PrlF toxin-antitoxin module
LPLTERVNFKTRLQKENRLQIPRVIRHRFKIEPDQTLKVYVNVPTVWNSCYEFLSRMNKSGRVVVPKPVIVLIKNRGVKLEGEIISVGLEPV